MKKATNSKFSNKIIIEDKRKVMEKRKCKNCKASYNGTRYQLWCKQCRKATTNVYYWDVYD